MFLKNNLLFPSWKQQNSSLLCGFTLPVFGNQALTRKSISKDTTTKQNRVELAKFLRIQADRIFSPHQIHSDIILDVKDENIGMGAFSLDNAITGDACITCLENVLLIVTWADCVPVIIFDMKNRFCAAVHSGWKGTELKIVIKTIKALIDKGSNIDSLLVSIGPAIKKCCYKVGEDFKKKFIDDKYFILKNNSFYFDLSLLVYDQILSTGIKKNNIDFSGYCTACNNNPEFFSCRKDGKEKFEAQAAFIGLFN